MSQKNKIENQELKSELETYNKGCSELRKIIEHKDDKIEELKKQLEEKTKIGVAYHKYASKCEDKVITLQNKINKAIEYINSFEYYIPDDDVKELLDILK